MATVVNTETQASKTAAFDSIIRSCAARLVSASWASQAARQGGFDMVRRGFGGAIGESRHGLPKAAAGPPGPRSAGHYILASRQQRSVMVMPTSFLPPNTVPFLPLARCGPGHLVGRGGQRHVFDLLGHLAAPIMQKVHKLLTSSAWPKRLGVDIDEDRDGQRLVGAVQHGFRWGNGRLASFSTMGKRLSLAVFSA